MTDTFELPLGDKLDLAAATPIPKTPPPTPKQMGQMRRRYFTVQHGTVTACEHPFDSTHMPSNNCFWCWQAYFKTVANLEDLHQILRSGGKARLIAKFGKKFVKMFGQFLADEMLPEEVEDGVCEEAEG